MKLVRSKHRVAEHGEVFTPGMAAFSAEGSLFAHLGKHDIFTPERTYPPATMSELAAATLGEDPKKAV